jgi:hypothetical protein
VLNKSCETLIYGEDFMIFKYFLLWFPMVIIGILNGSFRQFGYAPFMSELAAHQLSTIIGIIFFGLYIWFISRVWKIESAGQAWIIGSLWLGMTILFEFGFGHYIMNHSWGKLLFDYNILAGRLWSVILVWIWIAPRIFFRFRSQ